MRICSCTFVLLLLSWWVGHINNLSNHIWSSTQRKKMWSRYSCLLIISDISYARFGRSSSRRAVLVVVELVVDRSLINKLPAVILTIFLTASPHQHSKPCGGFEQSNKSPVAVQVTMVIFFYFWETLEYFPPYFQLGIFIIYVKIFHFPHFP